MATRFGPQPGREVLRRERWDVTRAALEIGVDPQHLMKAIHGRIRPSAEVRERLPKLVGVPLDQLFTAESVAHPLWAQPLRKYARVARRSL